MLIKHNKLDYMYLHTALVCPNKTAISVADRTYLLNDIMSINSARDRKKKIEWGRWRETERKGTKPAAHLARFKPLTHMRFSITHIENGIKRFLYIHHGTSIRWYCKTPCAQVYPPSWNPSMSAEIVREFVWREAMIDIVTSKPPPHPLCRVYEGWIQSCFHFLCDSPRNINFFRPVCNI